MRKTQNDMDIENPLEFGAEPQRWWSALHSSYDKWIGKEKFRSVSMDTHMRELISKEYPWLMIGYLKTYHPDEVI